MSLNIDFKCMHCDKMSVAVILVHIEVLYSTHHTF
jgi:hypothetical protein